MILTIEMVPLLIALLSFAVGSTVGAAQTSIVAPETMLSGEAPMVVLKDKQPENVEALSFVDGGEMLLTIGAFSSRLYSAENGEFLKILNVKRSDSSIAVSPDGNFVAAQNDGLVRIWNVQTGGVEREFSVGEAKIYDLAISPDNKILAFNAGHGIQLWDIQTARKIGELSHDPGRSFFFSPNSHLLGFTTQKGLEVWDVRSARLLQALPGNGSGFSPDGKSFLTTSHFTLQFHNVNSGAITQQTHFPNLLHSLVEEKAAKQPPGIIDMQVYFPEITTSPDGKSAMNIYEDGSIGWWDLKNGHLKRHLRGFPSEVMGATMKKSLSLPMDRVLLPPVTAKPRFGN